MHGARLIHLDAAGFTGQVQNAGDGKPLVAGNCYERWERLRNGYPETRAEGGTVRQRVKRVHRKRSRYFLLHEGERPKNREPLSIFAASIVLESWCMKNPHLLKVSDFKKLFRDQEHPSSADLEQYVMNSCSLQKMAEISGHLQACKQCEKFLEAAAEWVTLMKIVCSEIAEETGVTRPLWHCDFAYHD